MSGFNMKWAVLFIFLILLPAAILTYLSVRSFSDEQRSVLAGLNLLIPRLQQTLDQRLVQGPGVAGLIFPPLYFDFSPRVGSSPGPARGCFAGDDVRPIRSRPDPLRKISAPRDIEKPNGRYIFCHPPHATPKRRPEMRIIDLSLTVRAGMRGVDFEPRTTMADQGYNTRVLHLYSHAATHVDAPLHFVDGGRTIDRLDLDKCVGPAWVADLGEVEPRALTTVADLGDLADRIGPGDRLLLATGWSRRVDQPEYRDELPRVSLELARWLADRQVALLGVEPPSVADVNDREELIAVHRVLLEAGVVVVEGLAHLRALTRERVTFIALPLKIDGGDGTPVRAIAIEDGPEW